ncbi:MAG: DNA translocase FtsK 4TM domain-containing protein [Chloroflexota bacterium]
MTKRSSRSKSKSGTKSTTKNTRSTRAKKKRPEVTETTFDEVIIDYLKPYTQEMLGVLIAIVAFVSAVALLGFADTTALNVWTSLLEAMFGVMAVFVALAAFIYGLYLATARIEVEWRPTPSTAQAVGMSLLVLSSLPIAHLALNAGVNQSLTGEGGGWFGQALAQPIVYLLGRPAGWILYLCLAVFSVALILQITAADIREWLLEFSGRLEDWSDERAEAEDGVAKKTKKERKQRSTRQRGVIDRKKMDDMKRQMPLRTNMPRPAEKKKPAPRKKKRSKDLPPLDLLALAAPKKISDSEINKKKALIQKTLEDFDIAADVLDDVLIGPAITQFAIVPRLVEQDLPDGTIRKTRVRVNKIASIKQDLALALAAPRIRVQAPVPGQGIVGVEVPNNSTSVVRLGNVLNSDEFRGVRGTMGVGLGLDVSGTPIAADVTKLPHMLVAGQTGSGKSVFMNALITSLVMNNTPEDLQLIMIDPKKVELIRFNGLPHLLGKVEVEAERSIGVLRWLTAEMDDRYEKLAAIGARNITSYNQKIKSYPDTNKMPYIVAFIDELADLMVQYGAELERALCRLAQMARATGIHLIVATQRPSTDVLTGLIKANFPARTSFAVASGTDSRVIIDSIGAESLLGKGDMLFLGADANSPQRIQGCLVEDTEVEKVVDFWQDAYPHKRRLAPWDGLIERAEFLQEKDDLLERAIALAKKYDSVSTSMLQRRLRVGYPRAARLMEELYDMELVEDPTRGGRTRKSLVGDDADDPLGNFLREHGEDYIDYPDKPDFN